MKRIISVLTLLILAATFITGCSENDNNTVSQRTSTTIADIPEFYGEPYIVINNNVPQFTDNEITDKSYEKYTELDNLNRCGTAIACVGKDLMPTEERGAIGMIKPSGWHTVKYNEVDGKYLYNRCHLIGYQLTAENANKLNLITGTRFLNVEGMLPFENLVADYVRETGNHVMYRVTPVFHNNNLLCHGVQMEGYSVEDKGEGISFNIYAYNAQPGIDIDYLSGNSAVAGEAISSETSSSNVYKEENDNSSKRTDNSNLTEDNASDTNNYVLNTKTKKIHLKDCIHVNKIKSENRKEYTGSLNTYLDSGYSKCQVCLKIN